MIVGNSSTSPSTSPTHNHHQHYRSDVFDIPQIDHHLLQHLLLPRIINSIRFIYPQVYLDWTTNSTAGNSGGSHGRDGAQQSTNNNWLMICKDTLFWKRLVENVLQTLFLLGSCRYIYNSKNSTALHISTPAMQSLGMLLRPSTITSKGRIHQYVTKILALLTATTILPALYKELKIYRTKQLEEKERLLRYNEIRNEVRTSMQMMSGSGGDSQSSRNSERQPQHAQPTSSSYQMMQQRAILRKRHLLSYVTDTILGLSDICIPPLRLITYLSYLWGMTNNSNTPYLGMKLVGWEYATAADDNDNNDNRQATNSKDGQSSHQRHANFQYGNRRLMVEEAIRAVSMVVPPRTTAFNNDSNDNDTGTTGNNTQLNIDDGRVHDASSSRSSRRRNSWRNRFLSFMGITEDDNNPSSSTTDATDKRRYTLTCSKCHAINPSIPYITNCGHCYCYICLRMAVTDDLGFKCLDCGQSIISSGRPR